MIIKKKIYIYILLLNIKNLPVKQTELISSLSSQKAILVWPKPIVYLPVEAPSKISIYR